jgi:hypothetical protein
MADDPLAEFRKGKPQPKDAPTGAGGLPTYEAYKSQDKVVALNIHRATGPSRSPSYAYLIDISYGRRFYTSFRLFYTFMSVRVTGENLKQVVDAIRLRKCDFIQEFHPEEFARPAPGEPLIKKIDVIVKPLHESLGEVEAELETEK